jgi:hypothetical protein
LNEEITLPRPAIISEAMMARLGEIQMGKASIGARPMLMEEFDLNSQQASVVLLYWRHWEARNGARTETV